MRTASFSVGKNASAPLAVEGAAKFAKENNLTRASRYDNVVVNLPHAHQIAHEYHEAPSFDQTAAPHYKAMAEETQRQFEFLTKPKHKGGLGVDVSVHDTDPYKKARDMIGDVSQGKLKVLSTKSTGGHPIFSNDVNDQFRAVHDFFGHAATGRGFDPHGEEAAYRSHHAMFSKLAGPAMATETRGQNSALNYGSNPGEFAEQKVAVLPSASKIIPIRRSDVFHQATAEAKRAHEKAFGV